jgi:hypothetical protein
MKEWDRIKGKRKRESKRGLKKTFPVISRQGEIQDAGNTFPGRKCNVTWRSLDEPKKIP